MSARQRRKARPKRGAVTEQPPVSDRSQPQLRLKVLVVCLSVTLTILVVEFGVRWNVHGGPLAALATLYSSEVQYFGHGSAGGLRGDPVIGFRPDPDAPGFNRLAIHDPATVPPKQPGIPRILFIGDSITFVIDQGLPYEKGYVNLLRRGLDGQAEVLNGAVPGYTTHQERLWFERELASLDSDLVVLQYCLNDNFEFLHRFDSESGILATEEARRVFLPEEGGPLAWLPHSSYLGYRLRIALLKARGTPQGEYAWDRDIGFRSAWRDDTWQLFRDELSQLKAAVEGRSGKLALIAVPLAAQFDPAALSRDRTYTLKPQRQIAKVASSLGVPLLDLTKVYLRNGGFRLYLPDGIHLNEPGHSLTARATWEFLSRLGWLPSRTRETARGNS